MASLVFSPQSQTSTQTQENNIPSKGMVDNLINKILGSANPQATFEKICAENEAARNGLSLVQKYGNGDPKAAFNNYIAANGSKALGSIVMNKLGLGG